MNKIEKFEKVHQEAISFIKTMQNSDKPEMKAITNFLLNTDISPYDIMPDGWYGALYSSTEFESFLSILHHALFEKDEVTAKKIWKESYKTEIITELLYLALKNNFGRTIVKEKSKDLLVSLIKQKKIVELKQFISENPELISNINYFISKSYRTFSINEFKYFDKIGVPFDFKNLKEIEPKEITKNPEIFLKFISEKTKLMSELEIHDYYLHVFSLISKQHSYFSHNNTYIVDRFQLLLNIPDIKINPSKFLSNNFNYDINFVSELKKLKKLHYIKTENIDQKCYKDKVNLFINTQLEKSDSILTVDERYFFHIFHFFDFSYENKIKLILANIDTINNKINPLLKLLETSNVLYEYSNTNKALTEFFQNPLFDSQTFLFVLDELFKNYPKLFEDNKIFKTLVLKKNSLEKIDFAISVFLKNEELYLQLEKSLHFTKHEYQKINESIIFSSIKNNKTENTKKLKI